MKLLLLTAFCFMSMFCKAQNQYDPLQKYSYLIFEQNINYLQKPELIPFIPTGGGTAFFVRRNQRLFLISASHLFTGIDGLNMKLMYPEWEKISLRYTDTLGRLRLFDIDIRGIKDTTPIMSFFKVPDIYVYEMTDTLKDVRINSIEDFIYKKHKVKKGFVKKEAIIYGFSKLTKPVTIEDINNLNPYLYIGELPDSNHIEPLQYKNLDSLNMVLVPAYGRGASGAPVFFKVESTHKKKKNEWIEFAGVQFAANDVYNSNYIVKAEEVVKLIDKKLKQ